VCAEIRGVPQAGASNDSGIVIDDIFCYFGGYSSET